MIFRYAAVSCLLCLLSKPAWAQVVINEVFYHAPDDVEELEWIELYNPADEEVDLSAWSLANGVTFKFSEGTKIAAGGFLVLCKNVDLFQEFYDVAAEGGFARSLSNRSDTIELLNAASEQVDAVSYTDSLPWSVAADGYGASLERIMPGGAASDPQNWANSALPADDRLPGGTPGTANDSFSPHPLPQISELAVVPAHPSPQDPLVMTCVVNDPAGVEDVQAIFRTVSAGQQSPPQVVAMTRGGDGKYHATLPAQPDGTLVRVHIKATNQAGMVGRFPHPHALRPAHSVLVMKPAAAAKIPLAYILHADPERARIAKGVWRRSGQGFGASMMRANLQSQVDSQLDLGTPWYQLTINQTPTPDVFLRLQALFQEQLAKQDRLAEEVLEAEDRQAALQALPGRVQEFNRELTAAIKAALPEEDAKRYRPAGRSLFSGPSTFLKQILRLEQLWLALGTSFPFDASQIEQVREGMKKVHQQRLSLLPLLARMMTRQAGFEQLQQELAVVEQNMWTGLKPAFSYRQYRLARQWFRNHGSMMGMRRRPAAVLPARGSSAFVYLDPQTQRREVYDFVKIHPRSAGYKVRFHKDRRFDSMTTINVIFEVNERFVLAEPLAFDLYRRVGSPACLTQFVRLHVDQHRVGYYLICEQPNRAFLRRNGLNDDGDLFKLIWYGSGVEGQHERKTYPDQGHEDLLQVLQELADADDATRWELIEKHFAVDQLINYFAVNMCLSHWDGFFNNFFAYHDKRQTGKWYMFPWDQDKTWGFHDGTGDDEVFIELPLTYGMEGDVPPGGGKPEMFALGWWRPGGHFSRPLLANAEFRRRFLRRLQTILAEVYTEETYFPVVDDLADQLRDEVPIRAQALGQDPAEAVARFERNVRLLKQHLTERRKFLLAEEELRALAP